MQWPLARLSPTLIGSMSITMRAPGLPLRYPGRCARPEETQDIGDVWPQASRSWLDPGGAGPLGVSGPRNSCPDSDLSQDGRAGSRASQGPDLSRRQWSGGCGRSLGSRGGSHGGWGGKESGVLGGAGFRHSHCGQSNACAVLSRSVVSDCFSLWLTVSDCGHSSLCAVLSRVRLFLTVADCF